MRLFLLVLLFSTYSFSKEGGNGGGSWVCYEKNLQKTVRWIKFVDLYEAVEEFDIQLESFKNLSYQDILKIIETRVKKIDKKLYQNLLKDINEIKINIKEIDQDLAVIDDALYRIKPPQEECIGGSIEYTQIANYTNYGTILITQNLFDNALFSEIEKAALIFHEYIYSYLRRMFNDLNSVRARKIIGYLFSNKSIPEIRSSIYSILINTPGPVEMNFTEITGGIFSMGSPDSEVGRKQDESQRKVMITYRYSIMTTEVTQAMYVEYTGENPSQFKRKEDCPNGHQMTTSKLSGDVIALCPNNPVENVTYEDTQKFISTLNTLTDMNYRLPTEAEWELAARAGSQTSYFFGDDVSKLEDYALFLDNTEGLAPYTVGPSRNYANYPSKFGLFDMAGNVSEWTSDWYRTKSNQSFNPKGPNTGTYKVVKGGSYKSKATQLRSASRSYMKPSSKSSSLGFRLVRTIKKIIKN